MKVGQVTFFYTSSNYGQILQAYALQKVLESRGHHPILINHGRNIKKSLRHFLKSLILNFFNLINISKFQLKVLNKINRAASFSKFKRQYLKISPHISDINKTLPDADCFIVGSDQVWKYSQSSIFNDQNFYFLTFAKEKKYQHIHTQLVLVLKK